MAFILQMLLVVLLGMAFQVNKFFLISIIFTESVIVLLMWGMEYYKKKRFYNDVFEKLEALDKKYLITEMIENPAFLEGDLFCEALYEINKAMNENVSEKERSVKEFKEYVEMWIHEIKIPISAISLMNYNEKTDSRSYQQQMSKISNYVEQILYYVRADAPQKDYLMKKCNLEQMINVVLLEQKESLIAGHFTIEKTNTDVTVVSDAKWVQFMLGQIIHNSLKYRRGDTGYLGFSATENEKEVLLAVEDHGIGVTSGDLKRVFDKSFTGENGRKVAASTGMGLYICKKMCKKLGHDIWMESTEGEYTRIVIRFGKDDYYFVDT